MTTEESQDRDQPQDLTALAAGSSATVGPVGLAGATRSSWKVALGVVGALVVVGLSFSLGRATPAPTADSPAATPVATPVEPTVEDQALPVAIKGVNVLGEAEFGATTGSVICRQAESGGGNRRLSVAHIARTADNTSELLTLDEIAVVSSCDSCTMKTTNFVGEEIIIGTCSDSSVLSGMPPARARTSQWAFVVAKPGNELETALALRIQCAETDIEVDGDELVLTSRISPGGDIIRAIEQPPIRFSRQGSFFVTGTPHVLGHFCSVSRFDQLQGSPWRSQLTGRSAIPFLERESELGSIGFNDATLVAITNQQCAQLFQLQREAHRVLEPPETPPLATAVGWPSPEGFDDWFLTCIPER